METFGFQRYLRLLWTNIPKNKKVFPGHVKQKWHKFKISELEKLDKKVIKMIDDYFVIEKDKTVYIPAGGLNSLDISFFTNHSTKPNLTIFYDKNDVVNFVSAKKIKKGEELTVDYGKYDDKYR